MISEKSIHVLELAKILERVAQHTSFSAGKEMALEIRPTIDLDEARRWQEETSEARKLFAERASVTLGGARDVREAALSATRGIMIEASVLLDIRYTMRRATTLRRTIGRLKAQYPLLSDLINEMEECSELQQEIERVLDDNGEIKDSASPQLAIIRRELKIAFDRLQTRLQRMVNSSANAPYLQEQLVMMRNGRYVIPIKADYKGRIPGIVHDSSASGATLFIEPLETVELNNKWRELQLDEEKEIRRILLALTDMVGAESEKIVRTVEVLAYLDMVFARARYADEINAVEPTLVALKPHTLASRAGTPQHPGSTIDLRAARHPLLKGNVVPIDVELDDDTWVLVVTGPNTGGKTVSLKTVGLLTLMAQSGLHLPCEEARLSVFEGIYADIGDEQSIEQSLSTFSSHTKNIITILRECDARSLVLLDELGAGTDPAEGSALARAILTHLINRRVTTFVTTHHPELKVYSVETAGARNASVEFDLETLAPTYRLILGLPGRSNALAIATRLGLDEAIIADARSMVATEELVADDLLDEIHRTREEIRRQHETISALKNELQSKSDELQARLDKIEDERRNIIAAARRSAEAELENFRKELKKMRADMRDAGMALEKMQTLHKASTALGDSLKTPLQNAVEMPESAAWTPRLGDTVWLATLNAEGVVNELATGEALVQVGTLRVRASLNELQPRQESKKRQIKRGQARQYEPRADPLPPRGKSPGMELDLRGQRVEEALSQLDSYIDAAYSAGLPFARVIHGKGTGALRKAVREVVDHHPLIARAVSGELKEGGDGVTVIHLVPQV
ncbi:MAG: endonuclease MutS2 [Chloroflexi bacterium]|nr:endonuclease MutS2 [Chloroflexota bacterium]